MLKTLKRTIFYTIFAILVLNSIPVFAATYNKDLSISLNDIKFPDNVIKGQEIKIYASVNNNSSYDLTGVVKFYNERTGNYINSDQPISVLPKKPDDVFVGWTPSISGYHTIAVRLIPWETDGDNPNNNKITKKVYVDIDSDKDGTGNQLDADDDNDGTGDKDDAFPLDPKENQDTDKDGIGNNADTDDDNDGVQDIKDAFPLDSKESKDTDNDGVGDNKDAFPYDSKEHQDSDKDGVGDNADPNDKNHGPIPAITVSDTKVSIGKKLTFNAIRSRDPDGKIVNYEWNFGDGKIGTGVLTEHSYAKSGKYIATLKVTDDKKESRSQQIQIQVGYSVMFIILMGVTILLILLLLVLTIFIYKRFFLAEKKRKRKK